MNARLEDVARNTLRRVEATERAVREALRTFSGLAEDDVLAAALQVRSQAARQRLGLLARVRAAAAGAAPETPAPAADGIRKEAQARLVGEMPGPLTDARLAALARELAHLQIAGYGTAAAFASALGDGPSAGILARALADEQEWDARLQELVQVGAVRQPARAAPPRTRV